VRIIAHELGLDVDLVDTSNDAGQAALRALNPVWKVPAAKIDGIDLFDSAVISRYLLRKHGPGPLAPFDPSDIAGQNLATVVDGALDGLINVFYLGREGIGSEQAPYMRKQQDRAASAFGWLEERIDHFATEPLSLPSIALLTAIDWVNFRRPYPIERHHGLLEWSASAGSRPSLHETAPGT